MIKLDEYNIENAAVQDAEAFSFLDLSGRQSYYKQGYFGQNVIVAVVDTGVCEHDELKGKVLPGINLCNACEFSISIEDDNGHGTHVSGTVAGTNCGIAPQAKILPVKVLSKDGSGAIAGLIDALKWITDWKSDTGQRVDIVSMSLSCPESKYTEQLHDAVKAVVDKGIAVICASGNSGDSSVQYPSFFYEPITVGAVDDKLKTAYFSTRSKEVDVCQVGVNVTSCNYKGGFVAYSGTSMATPAVSGIAALIVSKYKALFKDYMPEIALYNSLKINTIDLGIPGVDIETGAGFCTLSQQMPHKVKLKIGEASIEVDGIKHDIDAAPELIQAESGGRILIPARPSHEYLGDKVEWIPDKQEVIITRI